MGNGGRERGNSCSLREKAHHWLRGCKIIQYLSLLPLFTLFFKAPLPFSLPRGANNRQKSKNRANALVCARVWVLIVWLPWKPAVLIFSFSVTCGVLTLVRDFPALIKFGTADQLRLFKPSTALPLTNLQFSQPWGWMGLLCIYLEKWTVQEKPSVDARAIKKMKKKNLDIITNSWTHHTCKAKVLKVGGWKKHVDASNAVQ